LAGLQHWNLQGRGKVIAAARRENALQNLVFDCQKSGGRALGVGADVSREADVETVARRAVS
jgi:NAD(P)-dependent dehydrogenase (short-subunit alcohol dehydrogenase family)